MATIQPINWVTPPNYANGVVASGTTIFLAGQTGYNPQTGQITTADFGEQVRQALQNVFTLLQTADANASHLVRLNWYILDIQEYFQALPAIEAAYTSIMGNQLPAMTLLVVAGLAQPGAKVEIEATAVLPA